VTEFAPNGSIRFEALMPKGGQNYRAFRFPWKGTPAVPPRVKAGVSKQGRGIFVSWNGATEVASWALRYGPSPGEIHDGRVVPRAGFETYLGRLGDERWAEAVALDAKGKVLGRSKPQRL